MIILDTDHVSILQWGSEKGELLRERLASSTDDWIGTTSITLEEQSRAIITRLGQCRRITEQPQYYARLASTYRFSGDGDSLTSMTTRQESLKHCESSVATSGVLT